MTGLIGRLFKQQDQKSSDQRAAAKHREAWLAAMAKKKVRLDAKSKSR